MTTSLNCTRSAPWRVTIPARRLGMAARAGNKPSPPTLRPRRRQHRHPRAREIAFDQRAVYSSNSRFGPPWKSWGCDGRRSRVGFSAENPGCPEGPTSHDPVPIQIFGCPNISRDAQISPGDGPKSREDADCSARQDNGTLLNRNVVLKEGVELCSPPPLVHQV
jgi:hypothetical protein